MCEVGTMKEVAIEGKSISVDSCIADQVQRINDEMQGSLRTLGCCCGHGKYPNTIVVEGVVSGIRHEFFTGVEIPRTRNLYYKDEKGIFHLPEVQESCLTLSN